MLRIQHLVSHLQPESIQEIKDKYILSNVQLLHITSALLTEMEIGLNEPDNITDIERKSSIQMLSSKVFNIPNGQETGIFYTLDLGGTNYRVSRIQLFGRDNIPTSTNNQFKIKVEPKYKTGSAKYLFDHLALQLKNHMCKFNEYESKNKNTNIFYPVAFTFSFPMYQNALNEGILLEWTKKFNIPDTIGKNITKLMEKSFNTLHIPAKIYAICNDTVGTLLCAAYIHKYCRIGLILGTGSNCAYIEPNRNNEIIDMEWSTFDKRLPRQIIDIEMDKYSFKPGKRFLTKMISSRFLGELIRLLSIQIFKEKITVYGDDIAMNMKWGLTAQTASKILEENNNDISGNNVLKYLQNYLHLKEFNVQDASLFANICQIIYNRSADIAVAALLAPLQKTGFCVFNNNKFELTEKYLNNPNLTVVIGVDGSLFEKAPNYKNRMKETFCRLVGKRISDRIRLVLSKDGSSIGAALAVATSTNRKQ